MPLQFRFLLFAACIAVAPMVASPCAAMAAEPAPVLLHNGERFLRIGNLGFAKANYDKLIANYPGTPEAAEAHSDLGVIAARQGNDALAVAEYEKALAIDGYPLAHFNLGQALLRMLDNGGDPALRAKALHHFLAFQSYLQSEKPRPPILTYSMQEVKTELDDALKRLR
ncbi:MAG: tetratricopeptide repeat protein [Humidesulfovibrio sp.]|jgi:tetratricopeptide (TPR) repeat protein|uniref:tetratricopeptide repeat protein n=1 Tax=Humidesulfovibrio sp. TaxID=2910988 RepID=UPI002733F23B|nr:tetratricopeptide repeat protein [Humidesulfovibrio sp.]MDP2846825.1 tetratricopeptide repeat protein [Humidesulfovibrio sp.]